MNFTLLKVTTGTKIVSNVNRVAIYLDNSHSYRNTEKLNSYARTVFEDDDVWKLSLKIKPKNPPWSFVFEDQLVSSVFDEGIVIDGKITVENWNVATYSSYMKYRAGLVSPYFLYEDCYWRRLNVENRGTLCWMKN